MAINVIYLFGLLGCIMLVLGLRGRSIDQHPICRHCGFDLHNRSEDSSACPECGSDITARRGVRVGHRRRSRALAVTGSMMLLIAACVVTIGFWASATQFNWNTIKPSWMLLAQLDAVSADRADEALQTLATRFDDDLLSLVHVAELADRLLAMHEDDAAMWSDARQDVLSRMVMRGALSDAQVVRYAKQMLKPRLSMRPRVESGRTVLVGIEIDRVRPAPDCPLDLQVYGTSFTINGDELLRGRGGGTASLCTIGGRVGAHIQIDHSPGVYPVSAVWELTLLDRNDGRELDQWTVSFDDVLEVVNVGDAVIGRIESSSLDHQMQQRIRVRQATLDRGSQSTASGKVDFRPLPMDVAFDVVWRIGEREWKVGEVLAVADGGNRGMAYHSQGELDLPEADEVTVILRPSDEAAKKSPSIMEIWGGELIFEDQPVSPLGQPLPETLEDALWWNREIEPVR